MPIAEPHSGLISAAHRYMRDAANTQLSPHGRYGAAMNALRVLCLAGVGDEHDQILVDLWEASRYDVDAWPSRYQVAVVMMHIAKLMRSSSEAFRGQCYSQARARRAAPLCFVTVREAA